MEEQWIVDRSRLRAVWLEHPERSKRQLAEAIGHSKAWVKKWLKRIRSRPLEDQAILRGESRARKRPPPIWPKRPTLSTMVILAYLIQTSTCLNYQKPKR
jgi:transposase